ncbi:hypothetical protein [Dactylosporangium sp. CA-092794]|uniref:hypothetical protein n=1 Tax=Dactylosporangium sp. CA-092794 TaxID=3239929 RepID=UPI003D903663
MIFHNGSIRTAGDTAASPRSHDRDGWRNPAGGGAVVMPVPAASPATWTSLDRNIRSPQRRFRADQAMPSSRRQRASTPAVRLGASPADRRGATARETALGRDGAVSRAGHPATRSTALAPLPGRGGTADRDDRDGWLNPAPAIAAVMPAAALWRTLLLAGLDAETGR